MATVDKELREKRKRMKVLHEMNQMVKLLFTSYVIAHDGIIFGKPIIKKEKPVKRYTNGYYQCNILSTFPELENCVIDAKSLFETFRDEKPEGLVIEDGNVILVCEEGKRFTIGRVGDVERINEHLQSKIDMIGDYYADSLTKYELSGDEIDRMVGYEVLHPKMLDNEEYIMYLSIGLFPLLKKLKHCIGYLQRENDEIFTVVFETTNKKDTKFVMVLKFLKLK